MRKTPVTFSYLHTRRARPSRGGLGTYSAPMDPASASSVSLALLPPTLPRVARSG